MLIRIYHVLIIMSFLIEWEANYSMLQCFFFLRLASNKIISVVVSLKRHFYWFLSAIMALEIMIGLLTHLLEGFWFFQRVLYILLIWLYHLLYAWQKYIVKMGTKLFLLLMNFTINQLIRTFNLFFNCSKLNLYLVLILWFN